MILYSIWCWLAKKLPKDARQTIFQIWLIDLLYGGEDLSHVDAVEILRRNAHL
jgi:hypothetical protein